MSPSSHKSQQYHKKDARSRCFQFILNKLLEHEITATVKQIKRKVESSKRSGTERVI